MCSPCNKYLVIIRSNNIAGIFHKRKCECIVFRWGFLGYFKSGDRAIGIKSRLGRAISRLFALHTLACIAFYPAGFAVCGCCGCLIFEGGFLIIFYTKLPCLPVIQISRFQLRNLFPWSYRILPTLPYRIHPIFHTAFNRSPPSVNICIFFPCNLFRKITGRTSCT